MRAIGFLDFSDSKKRERSMSQVEIASIVARSLSVLALLSSVVFAQSTKVEGLIKARNGETLTLQTSETPALIVVLTDSTRVGQVQGVLKARRKQMSMAALVPGLAVKVEGAYNTDDQLVAKSVSFKGNDLAQAQAIEAGMHESKMRIQQNEEELANAHAELEAHQAQLTEQQQKIAANKAAVDAAVARFGQLDDYYIFDEVTVYFGNGKVKLDPKDHSPLQALAQKATTINGYMIQVKGYASSSGSVALNQKLSEDRANNVTNFLLQQCHIPLTRTLAPGAMGESHQVGSDKSAENETENRRVVVRVLQNKGIAGIQ
jgi:outer membrane protein OmpA-like peptidoglycan-associated protein